MPNDFHFSLPPPRDAAVSSALEWLALAHGRSGSDDAGELLQQLLLLRASALPSDQRSKLLDLFFHHAERMVSAVLPSLRETRLPVFRPVRQRARSIQEALEALLQAYFGTLEELFDPRAQNNPRNPAAILRRIIRCIAWHIHIGHLITSPDPIGIWQQLHSSYRLARRLGIAQAPGDRDEPSIEDAYVRLLLTAIAQPASFCGDELEFISAYVEYCTQPVEILEIPPLDRDGLFWIDLDADAPAHAVRRRPPPADIPALYFSCDLIARDALAQLAELKQGTRAATLGLPQLAEAPVGRSVLRRLAALWGKPAKRRFPRRRQSYRVALCAGLEQLWQILHDSGEDAQASEWMVTNESPEGYALMHIAGETSHLRIGDVVAISPGEGYGGRDGKWHVGIVRWATSENPEHIELGMQQLASSAVATRVIRPLAANPGNLRALLLPEMPPLRDHPMLVTAAGGLEEEESQLILIFEHDNVGIREVSAGTLAEQTSWIDIFNLGAAKP